MDNAVFVAVFTSFMGAFVCIVAAIKIRQNKSK
ncbi:hypothetical protein HNR31_000037 [Anoxybacillus caldiproteolyticus]|uniref:Holin-like toxin n=1 Tax=Thermaerobacillus caldiproteolyticus TaxID=247480 RepID=A0A7V9Z3K0_9BACL|nr:hypothetical protein [Anoxybacillus caldiproteolyticus]